MKERRTRKEIKENTKIEFCREANSGLIEKKKYIYISNNMSHIEVVLIMKL